MSTESSSRPTLPAPAPGFPALVALHLRTMFREFPVAWIAFGGLALALPVVAAVSGPGEVDPAGGPTPEMIRVVALLATLMGLTVLVAFLWPEAVWRNLPPGGRGPLDALPADRRLHRMARVTAGALLPVAMALSVGLTVVILEARPAWSEVFHRLTPFTDDTALGVTLLSLLAAYVLSSAIAIRVGKVLVTLVLLVLGGYVVALFLFLAGWPELAEQFGELLAGRHWSPVRALVVTFGAESADLGPVALWLAVFLGVGVYWAGRHDRA